jgi:predicted nucleotidyltransferase
MPHSPDPAALLAEAGVPGWVGEIPAEVGYPAAFVTVSGAHLYGFPSVDSDVDLRGVHVLSLEEVIGLRHGPATLRRGGLRQGVELDLVSHDLAMFADLLLKPNGAVVEQLLSPLLVHGGDLYVELLALAPGCLTRHHCHHYIGFANGQWKLFLSTGELKPALYTLRVLLTGIHLMRTGEVVADLRHLYEDYDLPYVPDLIEAKRTGEHGRWSQRPDLPDPEVLGRDVVRLRAELDHAAADSHLPVRPSTHDALHDLVVRARLREVSGRL